MAELANRDKHESSFARRVARLMTRHRKELTRIAGSPPDPAKVPPEFWQKIEREMQEEIFLLLLLTFNASSLQHQLADGFAQFQTESVEQFGKQWSDTRSRDVGQGYAENTQKRFENGSDLSTLFGPRRAESIGITETTAAAVAGSEKVAEIAGFATDSDLWYTMQDEGVCKEFCLPLHMEPRYIWELKYPDGPPAHPRCRCHIEYVNDPDFESNIARLNAAQPEWFAREVTKAKRAIYGRPNPAPRRDQQ